MGLEEEKKIRSMKVRRDSYTRVSVAMCPSLERFANTAHMCGLYFLAKFPCEQFEHATAETLVAFPLV